MHNEFTIYHVVLMFKVTALIFSKLDYFKGAPWYILMIEAMFYHQI